MVNMAGAIEGWSCLDLPYLVLNNFPYLFSGPCLPFQWAELYSQIKPILMGIWHQASFLLKAVYVTVQRMYCTLGGSIMASLGVVQSITSTAICGNPLNTCQSTFQIKSWPVSPNFTQSTFPPFCFLGIWFWPGFPALSDSLIRPSHAPSM